MIASTELQYLSFMREIGIYRRYTTLSITCAFAGRFCGYVQMF